MLHWLWLSLFILVADQISKQLAESAIQLYERVALLPYLNLTLTYNRGAAFSFLSEQSGWQRWFFSVLAVVVTLVLVVWLKNLDRANRWTAISLSLIIGGAVGNLIDRLLFGHVIDFIDVYYGQWHWPAFNVADSAISIGVVLMLLEAFRGEKAVSSEQ
jgi:signal peptidase II